MPSELEIIDSHIQITVRCCSCGNQFDVEDGDANCTSEAVSKAEESDCPHCLPEEDNWQKDDDGNCEFCGHKCWEGQGCDEQLAGGFNS